MSVTIPPEITDPKLFPMKSSRLRVDTPEYWDAQVARFPEVAKIGIDFHRKPVYGEPPFRKIYRKTAEQLRDPRVQEAYAKMIEAGWPTGDIVPPDALITAFDAGITPDRIAEHYIKALKSYCRRGVIDHGAVYAFKLDGHGANYIMTPEIAEGIKDGSSFGVPNWRLGE